MTQRLLPRSRMRDRRLGRWTMKALILFSASLLVGLSWSPARADSCLAENAAKARTFFEEGETHYRLGELVQAAEMFKKSYAACRSPILLYNLGQTHRLLNQPEKAIYFYKQFLSASAPTDPQREAVKKLIEQVQSAATASAATRETSAPARPSTSETAPAAKPAVEPSRESAPVKPRASAPPLKPAPRQAQAPTRNRAAWIAGWSIAAVSVVASGVGIGLTVHGQGLYNDAKNANVLGTQRDLQHRSDTYRSAGWSLIGIGIGGVAVGALTAIIGGRRRHQERVVDVQPIAGGATASIGGSW